MSNEVFSGWSDAQLREYLQENGAPEPPMANRNQLIDSCVQLASQIERRLAAQRGAGVPSHQQRPGPPAAGVSGVPAAFPPPGGPKKKAFICGINYAGSSAQLRGCINDARCMHYLLVHRLGFRDDNILFMTDDHPDYMRRPTKANMLQGFQWLMTGLQPGDSLFFHYSGHGSQQRDYTGQEADGLNETICPLDFRSAGEIVDDQINHMLVRPLPQGVKLHAIVDACHSGSAMDLPFQATCHHGYLRWESENVPGRVSTPFKGTAGGFCVQFSASRDSQTAADTSSLSGGVATGAATFSFIQALERRGLNVSYGDLLVEMHNTLQRAGLGGGGGGGGGGGLGGGLLGMLGGGGGFRGQDVIMSANYPFDLKYKMEI